MHDQNQREVADSNRLQSTLEGEEEHESIEGTNVNTKRYLGGYMNVSLDNKWNEIAKLLGLAQENQEAVKECYKEYIGMAKRYYEGATRTKQEKPEDVMELKEGLRRMMPRLKEATRLGNRQKRRSKLIQALLKISKASRTQRNWRKDDLASPN
ncbi:bulb-type lectin domain-containing protein [Tanacetum coccineum]|uniref:Bulb-type lectin domain-containing protein n=1 Tax=Tanacetum coccineum TaxID=301880 RepID=A0ABQ4XIA6_9ASTR